MFLNLISCAAPREDLLTHPALGEAQCTAPQGQPPGVQLYCHTCLVTCHTQEAFENHCSSLEHAQMVAYDQAVPWEYRSPPMGLSTFELCPRPDLCEYGDICTKAHSAQELQEWVQRAQALWLREQEAWKDGLMPYRARLLAEYQHSSSEVLVLAETVPGVSITCHQPLVHQAQEKKTQHSWTFTVHSEVRSIPGGGRSGGGESARSVQHLAPLLGWPGAETHLCCLPWCPGEPSLWPPWKFTTRSSRMGAAWRLRVPRSLGPIAGGAPTPHALTYCLQVAALRQELRRRNLGEVSVGSFEILPGGWSVARARGTWLWGSFWPVPQSCSSGGCS
uniref:Uncharacterized protein n=1 Tax=Spermophilus dauricus TaxID=99837 RepID=A0A8C9PJW9_SPEDA